MIDRMLSGKWGYLEYICGHILCHSLLSASPAPRNGFSYAAAAVIVWIVNSHEPYGVAEEKNFTLSHMDKYYYCKAQTHQYMCLFSGEAYSLQPDSKKIIGYQRSRLPVNIQFGFLGFGWVSGKQMQVCSRYSAFSSIDGMKRNAKYKLR